MVCDNAFFHMSPTNFKILKKSKNKTEMTNICHEIAKRLRVQEGAMAQSKLKCVFRTFNTDQLQIVFLHYLAGRMSLFFLSFLCCSFPSGGWLNPRCSSSLCLGCTTQFSPSCLKTLEWPPDFTSSWVWGPFRYKRIERWRDNKY